MQPVTFHIKPATIQSERFWFSVFCVVCIGFGVNDTINLLLQRGYGPVEEFILPAGYEPWWHALSAMILMSSGAVLGKSAVRVLRHGSVDQNCLTLDRDGLTYIVWGYRRQWSWRQLSEFRITKTRILRLKFIEFGVPGPEDLRARLGTRAGVTVSPGKLVARIGDGYDIPLEKIAAEINEFRAHALGEAPAAGGVSK